MPVIAPWLTQNNPLEYMRAGAGLGVQARGQDISQQEAGQRLRFSYDQLAASQETERRRLAQQAAATSAAQALRAQQQNALMQYRQQEISNQQQRMKDQADRAVAALAEKTAYGSSLMDYRERALADKQAELDRTTAFKESAAAALKTHQDKEDKLRQQLRDKQMANEKAKEDAAKAKAANDDEDVETTRIFKPAIPGTPAEVITTKRKIHPGEALNAAVKSPQNPLMAAPGLIGPPAPGAAKPTTKEEYDALPAGSLYIDPDDGKTHRKQGGQ